jgi:hypothetical protein
MGGRLGNVGESSSKSSRCGDVGGVLNNSKGWSVGDFGGDGDLTGCDGAGGGVEAMGVMVGCGVCITTCDGVGVESVRKFSLAMGDDILRGEFSSDEEFAKLIKHQGLTLMRAVLLGGLDVEELFDLVMVKYDS